VDYKIPSRTHGTLVRKPAGKMLFIAHRSIGENNTKTDLKNIIWAYGMDSSGLGPVASSYSMNTITNFPVSQNAEIPRTNEQASAHRLSQQPDTISLEESAFMVA
jgi:hypothetical protein